jgi:ATP-binding cassette subfamily B protein
VILGGYGGFGMPTRKAKDFRGTLFRLLGYFRPLKYQVGAVLVAAILSSGLFIVGPKILGLAITTLFEGLVLTSRHVPGTGIDFADLDRMLLILAGLYLIGSSLSYAQQYMMASVAQRIVYQMRRQVVEKLARLPLRYYDSRTHGEILSRAVNDMDNISATLQQNVTQCITSAVFIVGAAVMMLSISPLLTLVVAATLPLSILVTKLITKHSRTYFARQQRTLGELNGHVEEMYNGHKIVKAFGGEAKSIAIFKARNDQLYEAGWRAQFVSGLVMPLMMCIGTIGYVSVAVIGGILVTHAAIQLGDIQAFIQYSRLFTQPITQLAAITNSIQLTIASAERVFELLDETEETPDPAPAAELPVTHGTVQIVHASFGYRADAPLFEDVNMQVMPGQTVAIVGPTGAGKTTLVNLLLRFYDLERGHILIDGVDIRQLRRSDLRRMFGMVLQDTWLFKGTIRENIAYGCADATESQITQAAVATQADHFIRTLPDGYDTELNQGASNLSEGQKQLLSIARAMLADPQMLILDEATSSVDARTEILIQNAMRELMKGRTSFVIAHRLSTIRDADIILVMDRGRIVEQGTHEQLLERGEFYAHLYDSQFAVQADTQDAMAQ